MDLSAARIQGEPFRPIDEELSPGTVLMGDYQIEGCIATGATGSVYLAVEIDTSRKVAIKVLTAERSARASIARRFHHEVSKAGTLGSPYIVEVLDVGELADGRLFVVMEYLEGHNLRHELEEVLVFDAERACVLMRHVALALAAAHEAEIIHRDLKPSNIMLVPGPDGETAKVIDFGQAVNVAFSTNPAELAGEVGAHAHSADYMAAELATDTTPRPTTDVYSVGVMLFEMLTGSLPFTARHPFEMLTLKLVQPAPSIDTRRPGLPPLLVQCIADCLSIYPAQRPADGKALVARLDEVLADLRRPGGPAKRADKTLQAEASSLLHEPTARWRVAAGSGLALAAAVVLVLPLVTAGSPEPEELAYSVEPADITAHPVVTPLGPPTRAEAPSPEDRPPSEEPAEPKPIAAHHKGPAGGETGGEPVPRGTPAATSKPLAPPRPRNEHLTPRCERVRARADEARKMQRWSLLRDQARHLECWADNADARKLQAKAAMELGDFSTCVSVGTGSKDPETQAWVKLCKKRMDE
ncbi:MAG TPA: protein kinase [Nannocystis sp.]